MMAIQRPHTTGFVRRRSRMYRELLYTRVWLDETTELQRTIKRDVIVNRYNIAQGSLRIISFSRELLTEVIPRLILPPIQQGKSGWGSCSLNLASRLGLLPSQPHAKYAEYEENVSINNIASHGSCYCGRISKQGLVSLISHHIHSIVLRHTHVSFPPTDGSPWTIEVNTRIGRFVLENMYGGWFVHFDGSVCMEPPLDRIPSTGQNIEDIVRASRGQYLINESTTHRSFRWRGNVLETAEYLATGNFFGLPHAVIYMPQEDFDKWRRLEQFSKLVVRVMFRIVQDVKEPVEVVEAVRQLPQHKTKLQGSLAMNSVAEKLAASYYLCYVLSKKRIDKMELEYFYTFTKMIMGDLTLAHQVFRSPRAEQSKLFSTSQDRFIRLFNECTGDGQTEEETESAVFKHLKNLLLNKPNDIALVMFQGFLSIVAQWNCARILSRAVVAPVEWLEFVSEEEDYIHLG